MSTWGRETVAFLEIDQPLCAKDYGAITAAGTCAAVPGVSGPAACYNTRATCQDEVNYAPGTLTLRFAYPQDGLLAYGYVIPSVRGIRTTPGTINLAGMDPMRSGLGEREVVNVELDDHLSSDIAVDKYRTGRAFVRGKFRRRYRPEAFRRTDGARELARRGFFGGTVAALQPHRRGSFWGKWLARNPYHHHYAARIREGYAGQALDEMRVRHYVVDRIAGPSEGTVTVVLKDAFALVEAKKAVAPRVSRGRLNADLTGSPATFSVDPAGIGSALPTLGGYSTITASVQGYVWIGDEAILATRSGDTFTVVTRGALGTTAVDHDDEDTVQLDLAYSAAAAHDIVYDLLVNYGGIDAALIDKPEWNILAQAMTELYTTHIAVPTPVADLIGELSAIAGCSVWPDISSGEIRFAALRPRAAAPVVDDRAWIKEGTLSTQRQDDRRVSQLWLYYRQLVATKGMEDESNFGSLVVEADAAAEAPEVYGTPAIEKRFSRWMQQTGARGSAEASASRTLSLFRDPPLEAQFELHVSRAGELDLAQPFLLATADVQDAQGDVARTTMVPVALRRDETSIGVKAQGVTYRTDQNDTAERVIFIDHDENNLDLLEIHNLNYPAPDASTPALTVTFIVEPGVTVGSVHVDQYAMLTGLEWPEGTVLTLRNYGRIVGKGGQGGLGRSDTLDGNPGNYGGFCLGLQFWLVFDNQGQIWGGAGGAGAGAGVTVLGQVMPGGGGGGGRGRNAGDGGQVQTGPASGSSPGQGGSDDVGGVGGPGWNQGVTTYHAGDGGHGGDQDVPYQGEHAFEFGYGQNGATSASPFGSGPGFTGNPGGGGDVGYAVVNVALITSVVNNGDIVGLLF